VIAGSTSTETVFDGVLLRRSVTKHVWVPAVSKVIENVPVPLLRVTSGVKTACAPHRRFSAS
jgi:hypothetical protein